MNFCIIGDLNARVADRQILNSCLVDNTNITSCRKSKDSVADSNGKSMLEWMNDCGGIILNGRSAGDEEGENTFIGAMGTSVIDYACCSINIIDLIDNFKVLGKPFSDHMPITVSFITGCDVTQNALLLPKLRWDETKTGIFRKHVTDRLTTLELAEEMNVDEKLEKLKKIIFDFNNMMGNKNVFTPKNKWFDYKCYNARKDMFKYLNLCRKFPGFCEFRIKYVEKMKYYREVCCEKRVTYDKNMVIKLGNAKDSKEWWSIANSFKNKRFVVSQSIPLYTFVAYFKNLIAPEIVSLDFMYAAPEVSIPILDGIITTNELKDVIEKSKDSKAPGIDRIPYEYYKNAPEEFIQELCRIMNNIYNSAVIPTSFQETIIFPIYKKGDIDLVQNYRGLSFSNTDYKLFTGILLNRIESWSNENNILCECQAGFRKNYSTLDNIFSLANIVQLQLSKKKKLYAFFVDFQAAFDTVNRQALFYKLSNHGMSSKMLTVLRKLYESTRSAIWNGTEISETFNVTLGVKQGCVLSPLLFSLFINDINEELPGGLNIGDATIKLLMYADDLVLFAEDRVTLQDMIDKLAEYCRAWGLVVNLNKSKTLVFRNGGRKSIMDTWAFDGNVIETVNEYRYLGVLFTYNLSFNKHLDEKLVTSKSAINQTWAKFVRNKNILSSNKYRMFEAVARSMMCYGGQVWGFKEYEQCEKLQRFFLKKMFCLPNNTPNYMLSLETGLDNLFAHTLKLHFDYIRKVMCLPDTRLTKITAREIIKNEVYWAKEWKSIVSTIDDGFQFSWDIEKWKKSHSDILEKIMQKRWTTNTDRAKASMYHDAYPNLKYAKVPNYFEDKNPIDKISLIFKARGGLLDINARAFKTNTTGYCDLCNLDEAENTYHFIARCPIFKSYRKKFLGSDKLSVDEFSDYLNGKNYELLYLFLKGALKYRNLIVNCFH